MKFWKLELSNYLLYIDLSTASAAPNKLEQKRILDSIQLCSMHKFTAKVSTRYMFESSQRLVLWGIKPRVCLLMPELSSSPPKTTPLTVSVVSLIAR